METLSSSIESKWKMGSPVCRDPRSRLRFSDPINDPWVASRCCGEAETSALDEGRRGVWFPKAGRLWARLKAGSLSQCCRIRNLIALRPPSVTLLTGQRGRSLATTALFSLLVFRLPQRSSREYLGVLPLVAQETASWLIFCPAVEGLLLAKKGPFYVLDFHIAWPCLKSRLQHQAP